MSKFDYMYLFMIVGLYGFCLCLKYVYKCLMISKYACIVLNMF